MAEMRPVGAKGLMFVQAQIQILPKQVLAKLLFILIVFCLMAVLLVYCLYLQFVVIRRTCKQLEERESAVYRAIHDLKAPLNLVFTILVYTQTTVSFITTDVVCLEHFTKPDGKYFEIFG